MIQNLFSKISKIDKSILKIIKKIQIVSFFICIISALILSMYIFYPLSHITYLVGLSLFKSGLTIAVFGFICGIGFDFLKR